MLLGLDLFRTFFAIGSVDISDEGSIERVNLLKVDLSSLNNVLQTKSEILAGFVRDVEASERRMKSVILQEHEDSIF